MEKVELKITHIIIGLNVGGAELMLKRLVEGTQSPGQVRHSIISLTDLGTVGKQLLSAGFDVRYLGLKGALTLPKVLFKLRQEIKRQKPNVVQTWMYHADVLGGLAAKSLKVDRIIWNVRNTNFGLNGLMHKLLIRLSALISKYVPDRIVYVSQSAQESHEEAGYDPVKSLIINNGFSINKYHRESDRDELRKELRFRKQDIVICSVGRYAPSKDHLTFIKAIKVAIGKNPNIKALMIGLNIDDTNQTLVNEIGNYTQYFYLAGQRNDIPRIFNCVDVFCLHSITEGFPNVLGEAMSSALPCITTKAGDAELILNDCRYTVDIRDFDELASKVNQMSNMSSVERAALGENNKDIILERYTLEHILNKYLVLYKKGEN